MFDRGWRGLGDDGTCQVPKPGVPMYYPPCPGYTAPASSPTTTSPAPAPGVYVAPTLTASQSCIDPLGNPKFTPDCVNANLATEAANQAALDAANRSVFVADCENAYALNKAQYEALGMPVPPDDCQYRTYGQTLPGTTGGSTAYVPSTPQTVIDWRTANPSGGVSVPWDATSAAKLAAPAPASSPTPTAPTPTPAPTAPAPRAGATTTTVARSSLPVGQQVTDFLSGSVQIGETPIPTWAIVAAAAVAAYFVFGGKK